MVMQFASKIHAFHSNHTRWKSVLGIVYLFSMVIVSCNSILLAGADPPTGYRNGFKLVVSEGTNPIQPGDFVMVNEKVTFEFAVTFYNDSGKHVEELPLGMEASYTLTVPQCAANDLVNRPIKISKPTYVSQGQGNTSWRKLFKSNYTNPNLDPTVTADMSFSAPGYYQINLDVCVNYNKNGQNHPWQESAELKILVMKASFEPGACGPESTKNGKPTRFTSGGLGAAEKALEMGHGFYCLRLDTGLGNDAAGNALIIASLFPEDTKELLGNTIGWRADGNPYNVMLNMVFSDPLANLKDKVEGLNEPGKLDFDNNYDPNTGKYKDKCTRKEILIKKYEDLEKSCQFASDLWLNKKKPKESPDRKRYKIVGNNCCDVCIEQGKEADIDISVPQGNIEIAVTGASKTYTITVTVPGDLAKRIKNYNAN